MDECYYDLPFALRPFSFAGFLNAEWWDIGEGN